MKRVKYSLLFFILLCNQIYSQTYTYEFSQDASGNRIVRWLEISKLGSEPDSIMSMSGDSLFKQHSVRSDDMVTIFPNPNKGFFTIRFLQERKVSADFTILNFNGQVLMKGELPSSSTEIDISSFPAGTYIVKIKAEEITESWKIIKLD